MKNNQNGAPEHDAIHPRDVDDDARDLMARFESMETPRLSPAEKVRQFETAWQRANHRPVWNPVDALGKLLMRPAIPFVGGGMIGMMLTLMLVGSGESGLPDLDKAYVNESHAAIEVTDYVFFETVQGTLVDQAYPHIENPVVVKEKPTEDVPFSRQAVHGTMNNGQIKIVWNL